MLVLIEERLPDLSRAEQRVARWVLEHPRQAADATLADVAAKVGTSEPTVIRFCRHVGLEGFREFTLRMTEALSRPAIYVHRDVSEDDTTSDAVSKVMDASIRTLIDIRARATSMPFDKAAVVLSAARQIVFGGVGASGHVADDACNKFFRLGIPCVALTNMPSLLQYSATLTSADSLILISHSGRWPELLRAANLARGGGSSVIAVTNPLSELAGLADILFPCTAVEDASVYTPMSSRLAHLALLDALQVALALKLGDKAVDHLKRSKAALL